MSAEEPDWDVRHPAYTAGVREGREQGAKHMRDSIARYLREAGIEVPPLPRTLGERKAFERDWDSRVAAGSARAHNHVTRDIKPRGQCPGCDAYHDSQEQK